MKITITGGKGFIGTPTARYAQELGHEVAFFDRRDGNDILGDLSPLAGSDAVIHLAGLLGTHELFDDIQSAIDVNVTGSYRIMKWCLDHDARYVGILMPNVFPSVYRATKMASHYLAEALQNSRGLKSAHVRSFNAFGPGQAYGPGHPQKIIPTFAVNAWRGEPIPVWGDGRQTVDLIYVDDLAKLLVAATEFTNGEVFDGGTGTPFTVAGVASMVKALAGSQADTLYLPMRDGERPTDIVAKGENWDLLPKDTVPKFRYGDLVDTVNWYKDQA
jgi:UDP-glucose 4-epimerase